MAQSQARNEQGSFSVETRRQSVGPGLSGHLRTTTVVPSARDLQIVDSTLSVVGGDLVHNHSHHYHYRRPKDIWAILQSIPNFRNMYHDMLSKATSGTGMWLLKGNKFRLWLEPNGDIMIFWGSGIPGAGKTLLASMVIECLEDLRKESNIAICVCYVYFRYSDRSEMTVRNVLETLVKQVLERHPECFELIQQTYAQHIREGSEPTEGQLLGLLREVADCMACTFCVLDALDEAPTKIQLAVVKKLALLNVKLFITSRPLKGLEANFPEAHTFHIIAQEKDIDLLIAKRFDESADLQDLIRQAGPSLKDEIVSTIKQKCGGMFLHAALQLDALSECLTSRDVRDTLEGFPSEIEGVYRHTWARICNQGRNHSSLAKAVLIWVLNASRPMTAEELGRAVATSPTTHKLEPDRLVSGTSIVSLCRGLVTVEEESRLVRLVHYTAKHTLEGLLHESFPRPHCLLAAVCVTRLAECGFQNTTIGSEEEFKAVLKKDPLLAYASEAWAFHAHAGIGMEDTKRQTAQFVTGSIAFPAFTSPDRSWHFDVLTPLHILGLYNLPLILAEDTVIVSANLTTRVHQQSPLIIASGAGHYDFIVRLLELSETQVNLVDADGWSALMLAARCGSESIVELLLAHPEIQVNLVNHGGWSALLLAARHGFEGVIALLLAYPTIQANLNQNDGWSALMLGANEGYEGIVKLLLAHSGIQVNQANKRGLTALMLAAERGREGIARLLLAHVEIYINLVDSEGWSALMLAASYGSEGVAILLLAYPGIQVNLISQDGATALMLAASKGYEGVVKLLLAHPRTQFNLVNSKGWSALMLSAKRGHEGVVALLLAYSGIQVNLVSNTGWSALLLAARYGFEGIVMLLLAYSSIQANLVQEDGWSALMLAANEGHEGIIKLLLAHPGIRVDQANRRGSTALMLAAERGHKPVVKLLLTTSGLDVKALDKDGEIEIAAEKGHEAVALIPLDVPNIDTTTDKHAAILDAQARGHSVTVALFQDLEPQKSVIISSTSEVSQVYPDDSPSEDESESDRSESYQDAEEGPEDLIHQP